jgi:putative endopeptidase
MTTDRHTIAPLTAVILFGLASAPAAYPEPRPTATAPAAHGIDLDGLDRSVAPGDDFFAYANGTWLKKTEIPSDRSSYGIGSMLDELTSQRTAALIKEAASRRAPAGSEARKIGDYSSSFMDEAAIEAKALRPLQPTLDRIAGVADKHALARALGGTLRADVDVLNNTNLYTGNLLGLWVAQDLDEPAKYSPFLLQGGLGMPDREYYTDPSPRMADIRSKYQAHIAAVLKLARVAGAEAKAAPIFDLELRIAQTHESRAGSEDVVKGNNHWTRQDFEKNAPGLDWTAFFAAAGLGNQSVFVVWQPAAVTGISALVAAEPLETWKDYLSFRAIEHASPFLPKALVDETFAFYGHVLTGTPKIRDRWKRGVDATSRALGEAVGKLYAERYFPPSEKARAQEMVRNLMEAIQQRINRLDWMAPETKARAKAKLATLKVGVGYPDQWRDYSGLEIVHPVVAWKDPGTGVASENRDRQPCSGRVPRRHGAQSRCLVCRVRREVRPGALSRPYRPRPRLVNPPRSEALIPRRFVSGPRGSGRV